MTGRTEIRMSENIPNSNSEFRIQDEHLTQKIKCFVTGVRHQIPQAKGSLMFDHNSHACQPTDPLRPSRYRGFSQYIENLRELIDGVQAPKWLNPSIEFRHHTPQREDIDTSIVRHGHE